MTDGGRATVTSAMAKDEVIRVALRERSYEIRIGHGSLSRLGQYLSGSPSKRAFVIADERLQAERGNLLAVLGRAGWRAHECAVSAGESLKAIDRLYPIYGDMLKAGIDRGSTLIALGGGSVGDAAGFVASTYLRGIRWVGLPTTLLAQVDSSVGGKTAVNHPLGKNLIGTFHQPCLVLCETDFLKTLSEREVVSGLGEAIKYGLAFDPRLFSYIQDHWSQALRLDEDVLKRIIKASLKWKAKAVSEDEFDSKGAREVLNFGHTFGHALEAVTDYQGFQHGEAVLWGMRFAAALSRVRGKLSEKSWREVEGFLITVPLPSLPSGVKAESYFRSMANDKKAREGKVRFVLLKKIGETVSDGNVGMNDLRKALRMIGEARTIGGKNG